MSGQLACIFQSAVIIAIKILIVGCKTCCHSGPAPPIAVSCYIGFPKWSTDAVGLACELPMHANARKWNYM
jgi:hypothetical protein